MGIYRRAGREGWTLDYRDAAGQRVQRTFPTLREAQAADHARRIAPLEAKVNATGRESVGAWARTWLERTRRRVAPATARVYAWAVERHLVPLLGHLPLRALQRPVNRLRATLHLCLHEAVLDGLLAANPAQDAGRLHQAKNSC